MRQVRDAAAIERASAIVANIGTIALAAAAKNIKRAAENPLNKTVSGEPVRFVRGARVRDQFTIK